MRALRKQPKVFESKIRQAEAGRLLLSQHRAVLRDSRGGVIGGGQGSLEIGVVAEPQPEAPREFFAGHRNRPL